MTSAVTALLQRLHEQSHAEIMTRARTQFRGSNAEFMRLADEFETLAPGLRGRFLELHGLSSEDVQTSQGTTGPRHAFIVTLSPPQKSIGIPAGSPGQNRTFVEERTCRTIRGKGREQEAGARALGRRKRRVHSVQIGLDEARIRRVDLDRGIA